MENQAIFEFKTDISRVNVPEQLNNPFGGIIPEIVRIAASEFQEFITSQSQEWAHDFRHHKGKMFGILVVRQKDGCYVYLGTLSGKLMEGAVCESFVPSVFDDSTDDFFINKGMRELSVIGDDIKGSSNQHTIDELKELRKQKSYALQQWLFEQYVFLNVLGQEKGVLQIFEDSAHGNPPSAAGECAAPKLLHYAFKHGLEPIALAEFWWGSPPKNREREHQGFYPACRNKCRPILEYMLNDTTLYTQAKVDDVSR